MGSHASPAIDRLSKKSNVHSPCVDVNAHSKMQGDRINPDRRFCKNITF